MTTADPEFAITGAKAWGTESLITLTSLRVEQMGYAFPMPLKGPFAAREGAPQERG